MKTRTVRLYADDVDRIKELSGLKDSAAFATHMNSVLCRAREATRLENRLRNVVREELGGARMKALPLSDRILFAVTSQCHTARSLARLFRQDI